ncbi:hypothetical protein NEOLEDRAFT_1105935 [Neolentinus lepideus HHB14362 ss-1]|uniref:Uncharacterized protein n=1 Tax=Neolentinus lepideus HHB14362 ss-1 TaxID=1314782 RepID=A0A165VW40_9AGAM|nr:hypothetical protein NEOLEDRAFT_1105935 [Neolentinus lepideus HHB14362 ss-1]
MSCRTSQLGSRIARRSFSASASARDEVASTIKKTKSKKELILEKEFAKQIYRRKEKAERDERVDITKALSPVKTYEGGFTRPQMLRTSNWWKGGSYLAKEKSYETPLPIAYEPHTVILLESRYPINMPVGRPDSYEHILVAMPTTKVSQYLAHTRSPDFKRPTLDMAQWPWMPKKVKHVKWWEDPEDRQRTYAELNGEIDPTVQDTPEAAVSGSSPSSNSSRAVGMLLASSPSTRSPMQQAQVRFYSSRPPPDKDEDAVPEYFVERKRQRDAISERKEQEGDLMYELSAGIIADALSATTQGTQEKTPFEFTDDSGAVLHPSGFAVPSGTGRETDSPVFDRRKSRKEYKERQTAGVRERVREMAGLKDDEVVNIVEGGVRPREEKIPVEIPHPDGTVAHPSGFVPPVPNTSFTYGVKNGRAFHSSAIASAVLLDGQVPLLGEPEPVTSAEPVIPADPYDIALQKLRSEYEPTLEKEPFWRPLLTLELSTRPLAETIRRLSTALPRGLSYPAAIAPEQRLDAKSFTARIRCLRLQRMQQLTKDTAELLAGYRGGFVGIRFSTEELGRGTVGEGMERPIPGEKRAIKVGVGEWYRRAGEVKEGFVMDAEHLGEDAVEVFGLDEFGERVEKEKESA